MQDSPSLGRRSIRLAARERHPGLSSSHVLPKTLMDRTWTPGHGVAFRAPSHESVFPYTAPTDIPSNKPPSPPNTTASQPSFVASSIAIFRQIVFILSCIKCSFSALQQYQNTSLSTIELVTKYTSGTKGPDSLHSFIANPYTLSGLLLIGQLVMNKWSCIAGGFNAVTSFFSPRSRPMARYWPIIMWAIAALLVQIFINVLIHEDCLRGGDIDKRVGEAMQKAGMLCGDGIGGEH